MNATSPGGRDEYSRNPATVTQRKTADGCEDVLELRNTSS
jgi:hypothetical protein